MITTNAMDAGWMQTFTGKQFFPANPQPDKVDILDIAAPLSKMCRYGGHCLRFYSVAEHCVLAARHAPDHLKLTALMHDASEAYLVDIPKPLKGLIGNYYSIESKLMKVIAEKYGFQWPLPQEVKDIDMMLLRDEREQNMAYMNCPPDLWGDMLLGTGRRLEFWSPEQAQTEFIKSFYTYANTSDRHAA